jgi:hypothetical protein
MPTLPRPSELIKCKDIVSCFQSIYNFLFAILIALAFLNFLYGAFLYLLSGAGIYKKEEGKNRMINSIVAVVIVLIIPIFLGMINPRIFNVKLKIPRMKIESPTLTYKYKGEDPYAPSPPDVKPGFIKVEDIIKQNNLKCLKSAPGVQVNIHLIPYLKDLDKELCKRGLVATITSGYSPNHDSPCHTKYGTCIDIAVSSSIEPCEPWQKLGFALKAAGFSTIIYETKAKSGVNNCEILNRDVCGIQWKQCPKTTGPHIHASI